jgi:hypothetical protein
MTSVFAALQAGAPAPGAGFLEYLTTITTIGVITMALIQTAKDMLPIRRWFQGARFRTWLRQGIEEARADDRIAALAGVAAGSRPAFQAGARPVADVAAAETRIVTLATDGDADALYDLPIEQMCGQINAAMQVVLEYPWRPQNVNVVAIVASQSAPEDLATMFRFGAPDPAARPGVNDYNEAKTRVMHQFQRAIDAFQIAVNYRWKLAMQIASLVLCGVLTFVAMEMRFHVGVSYVGSAGAVVVGAVLAGFLAPVARDLTAAVQNLRK